jgi:hypothetical protein
MGTFENKVRKLGSLCSPLWEQTLLLLLYLFLYFNFMGIVSIKRKKLNKLQLQKQNSEYMCNTNDFA